MKISSPNNNYQTLVQHQKPAQFYNQQEVYKASNGNATLDKDGKLALTPQGTLNIEHAVEKEVQSIEKEVIKEEQALRNFAADVIKEQSQKMQVEIYLAVATQGMNYGINDNTVNVLELLREAQLENNIVEAYSAYEKELNTLI